MVSCGVQVQVQESADSARAQTRGVGVLFVSPDLPISRSLLHREQQAAVPSVVISGCSEMYRHQDRLTLKAHQDGRKKRDAFLPEGELIF